MRAQAFPARLRLKQRREFLRVQRGGRKLHVRHFLIFVGQRPKPRPGLSAAQLDRDLLPTRCGITVTRKVGNAVTRNRIKRLVREVFRRRRAELPPGLDFVWVAKQQASQVAFAGVNADFTALVQQLASAPRGPRRGGRRRGTARGSRGSGS